MAEVILTIVGTAGIVKAVVGILTKLAADEMFLLWNAEEDLRMLIETLKTIEAATATAEKLQVSDASVRLWLRRLKVIAYDIEDLAAEVSYETMRHRERGICQKALDLISSDKVSYAVVKKVQDINKRLDWVTKNNNYSKLPIETHTETSSQSFGRETSPRVPQSPEGRKADKFEILRILITSGAPSSAASSSAAAASSSSASNFQNNQYPEKVSVVSIVGMGGVGKTTLAGLIYKDKAVESFDPKIWVFVGGDFDARTVLLKIIKCIFPETRLKNTSVLGALENKVEEQLKEKKYLLVLDDIWNVRADEWEKLKRVLATGHQDSKVLITSREIPDAVKGGTPPYELKHLRDEDCWKIIKTKAFSPGGAKQPNDNVIKIGREIAKRCMGLPLAANSLGCLMHSNSDWESIRDDDTWNDKEYYDYNILPILKLSYDNFPSELKQCFSYCSIFPKNWEINRVTLVRLWIAEGFLDTCKLGKGKSIEDIADKYFDRLVWNSFLDGVQTNLLDDIVTCKMHNIVHDLANSVVGDHEMTSLKVTELNNTSEIRRLQLTLDVVSSSTLLKRLSEAKKLRTLFIPEGSKLDPSTFSKNNLLRILQMDPSPNLAFLKMSSLRVNLIHLRYLRLTSLDLKKVKHNRSISKLHNLETLVLTSIYGVKNLLSKIQSLEKLRYLELSFTDMEELPDSVTSLPNLQTLDLNHCEFKVIPNSISGLKNLSYLNLSFNPIEELPVSINTLSNLKTLEVNNCKYLKALPESVSGLAKLMIFDFKKCPLIKGLPENIGDLTQLRYLNLDGTGIVVLPNSCAKLNNLEYVNLFNCKHPNYVKNWRKLETFWLKHPGTQEIIGMGKIVRLQELDYECNVGVEESGGSLNLFNLQNLKNPIDAEVANLKGKQNLWQLTLGWREEIDEESGMMILDEVSCNEVFEALQPPTGLKRLSVIKYMGSVLPTWMHDPSGLPNLVKLELINCLTITQLPASIGQLPHLLSLSLTGMWFFKSLDIDGFPSLRDLTITEMFLLEELCYSYPGLEDLIIDSCTSLTEIPLFPSLTRLVLKNKINQKLVCSVGRSQTYLTQLRLENIEELIYFPVRILQKNCNLQTLQFKGCNQFEGFGVNDDENENVVGPSYGSELYSGSLQVLEFVNCPVLKLLPNLRGCTSLQILKFYDCAVFEFLPDLRGWPSPQQLTIFNCPLVKGSLTYNLKSIPFRKGLFVDFIQRDEQRGDPSTWKELINLME